MDPGTSALIEAIAAAVQAVATVVLVAATLRYVVLTRIISTNSENSLKAIAHSSLLNRLDTINKMLVDNPRLYAQLLRDDEQLIDDSSNPAHHFTDMLLTVFEEVFYRKDIIDEELYNPWKTTIRKVVILPYVRQHWGTRQCGYPRAFREFIDGIIKNAGDDKSITSR